MNSDIVIKKADLNELNEIVGIFKSAINVMFSKGIDQWDDIYPNEEILREDIQKNELFIAQVENKIAAVFVINQEYDTEYDDANWQYKNATFSVLHRLCVNTAFQGKGIGTRTVMEIEKYLKNRAIETIRLDTFSENYIALRMYEALGYKRVGEVNWRKGLFYLLEKKL